MSYFDVLQLLPIEVLIYKIQLNGNHITFRQAVEPWLTDDIKQTLIENGLTWELIPYKMGDEDFISYC